MKKGNMMTLKIKRWLPLAICCLPGVIVALAIVGASLGLTLDGPLSGLVVLAVLACPLTMFLILARRARADHDRPTGGAMIAGCCVSPDYLVAKEADRLSELRTQREELQNEVAELQAHKMSKF